jgi:hypothetical protein
MALGAAAGVIILMTCIAIAVPYIVIEMRKQNAEA